MKQILWFRRDLRIHDNAILSKAKHQVFPIFIFDINILSKLKADDKRITFLYNSVLNLKKSLKKIDLDLAIFMGDPIKIFESLKNNFDEVLCSIDFHEYSRIRDNKIEKIIPLQRFIDSFILNPTDHLKKDGTPYKVFTPFYKSLKYITNSKHIEEYKINKNLKQIEYDYNSKIPTLEELGFIKQNLPKFLNKSLDILLNDFSKKIKDYEKNRDFFYLNGTSNLSVHLRFGLISPKEVFNFYKKFDNNDYFIKELFWREFYNYILFFNPKSEFENFNDTQIEWNNNEELFDKWCKGKTGIPIIDASMIHLNKTGIMHNRLRMINASFLTKNLFIHWKKAEKYFASKLLDYEVSSNVGSWQWAASTGADSVPYFRIFNPYIQSKKFDKDGIFIKKVLPELKNIDPKLFHIENGLQNSLFCTYPKAIVNIKTSSKLAIIKFKDTKIKNSKHTLCTHK